MKISDWRARQTTYLADGKSFFELTLPHAGGQFFFLGHRVCVWAMHS